MHQMSHLNLIYNLIHHKTAKIRRLRNTRHDLAVYSERKKLKLTHLELNLLTKKGLTFFFFLFNFSPGDQKTAIEKQQVANSR
jgi:hypothetical protein